jgi:hypothetical protein
MIASARFRAARLVPAGLAAAAVALLPAVSNAQTVYPPLPSPPPAVEANSADVPIGVGADGAPKLNIPLKNTSASPIEGDLVLTSAGGAARRSFRADSTTELGKTRYRVAPNSEASVPVTLNDAGITELATANGGILKLDAAALTTGPDGRVTRTVVASFDAPASPAALRKAVARALELDPSLADKIAKANPAALAAVAPALARKLILLTVKIKRIGGRLRVLGKAPKGTIVNLRLTMTKNARRTIVTRRAKTVKNGFYYVIVPLRGAKVGKVTATTTVKGKKILVTA